MNETLLLDGRLRIKQPVKGHRAGTDAILLAACLSANAAGPIMDLGAGVGTVGLVAGLRAPKAEIILVERDENLVAAAKENIRLNGFESRMRAIQADILLPKARREAGLLDGSASIILTNPPFYSAGKVNASPLALKQAAYLLDGTLTDWLRAASALLAPKGKLYMVHRAAALGEIIAASAGRLGALRIMPVYPRANEPASRLLISAVKGGRAAPVLLPGLILHEGRSFTPQAEAIHRGAAFIDLS